MEAETIDAVHAYIAYQRVDARRRELLTDLALIQFNATGKVDRDALKAKFKDLWQAPTDDHLLNEVATKCRAAIEYHNREFDVASTEVERAERSVQKFGAELRQGAVDNAIAEDRAGVELSNINAATELLDAATAKGADPELAPSLGSARSIPADVDEAVTEVLGGL